jgi:hypothetical protein
VAFFFTEDQFVDAARKAYREQDKVTRGLLESERKDEHVPLLEWTDPDTEIDQLGLFLTEAMGQVRPNMSVAVE